MPGVASRIHVEPTRGSVHAMYVVNARLLFQPGGLGRYSREISKRLNTRDMKLVAPSRPEYGSLRGQLWEQLKLPRHVGRYDVLWSPANLGPVRVHNQVVTIHDMAVLDHPEWFSQGVRMVFRSVVPWLVRSVAYVITDSAFSKDRLLAHFGIDPNKVIVIYPGASRLGGVNRSDAVTSSPIGARHSKSARCRAPYAIAYGLCDPRKNLGTLIEAWRYVVRDVPDLELAIVGAPSSRTFSRNASTRGAPRIRYTGYLEDSALADLYAGASLFIYPSLYEGFGLPPLEAMLYGVPSVVSDIPVLREVYGDSVSYVDPYDPTDVARGVIETVVCGSAREQLIKTFERTVRNYSWDRTSAAVRAVLDRVGAGAA